ncbi:hypothetical protein [Pectobacterium versatile]|uniref:hypothetical protein n=1 Tax=Pectobacterium versatile TaxID=2488639 RepID=UPI001CF1AE71|nr:hypothetical protein [Pectobacterium versatile]MCA6938429.1 hypothetical protein [Pectobacterium versatile]
MLLYHRNLNHTHNEFNWLTIQEATNLAIQIKNIKLTEADIYRHALYGSINLSIYFQSPVILRKIQTVNTKVKIKQIDIPLLDRLCIFERNCFLKNRNFIISTEGGYLYPTQQIFDTTLFGYEFSLVQRLLAMTLGIPFPSTGLNDINYGISIIFQDEIFQLFEKLTFHERITQQRTLLPDDAASIIFEKLSKMNPNKNIECFPIHQLPQDACFIIRHAEFEKLISTIIKSENPSLASTRISTPLSRLFWLACKNNESIRPLIKKPYKLLSIFEQWASVEGMTDRFSGDTLKTALERGSPTSI